MNIVASIKYILKQFPFIYPRGFIKSCLKHISASNDKTTQYLKSRGLQYYLLEEPGDYFLDSPKTVQKGYSHYFTINQAYTTVEKCLFFLPDSYIYGDEGVILSNRHYLYEEFTHHFNIESIRKKTLREPFKLFSTSHKIFDGTVASLLSPQSHNIYHWFFDVLSRIRFYDKVRNQIDYFLVSESIPPAYLALLGYFNIPENQVVRVKNNEKIHCKYLYVSSLSGSEGRSTSQDITALRTAFRLVPYVSNKTGKRLYIKRGDTNSRRITNENEIIEVLKKNGFEVVEPGILSIEEQICIFQEASIVISYHGAALFNLLFVPDTCKVVELFSVDYFRTDCYYNLACLLGLEYWYLVGSPSQSWGDCNISTELLSQTIRGIETQINDSLSHG